MPALSFSEDRHEPLGIRRLQFLIVRHFLHQSLNHYNSDAYLDRMQNMLTTILNYAVNGVIFIYTALLFGVYRANGSNYKYS